LLPDRRPAVNLADRAARAPAAGKMRAMPTERLLVGHRLLGLEGLALLRGRDGADPDARVDEMSAIIARLGEPPYSAGRTLPAIQTAAGYAAWAAAYDAPGNVTVALEEEVVHALLAELPAGLRVLDAACGTGRHAAFLAAHGHEVIGVDSSPEMLALARAKVPSARFEAGDLERLPLPDASVDAAVCALALSHAPDIRPGVAELGRVVRPGGSVIVSNPHPFATELLDWRATIEDEAGTLSVITEYPHRHGECIAAFSAAGLRVERCLEPALSGDQAAAEAKPGLEDAFRAALDGFPVVIVWVLSRDP
jgi:SAM-dependent methyltransferase